MSEGGETMTEFETIYRRYFTDVELYLRAITRDVTLAEELTEQVFFQALKALPKFRGECDVRTWLCAMGKNCYLSHLRKIKPSEPIDELQIPDPGQPIEERLQDSDQAMEIHRLLHALPEPYKEVFSLRVFGQLSFEDIGSIFGRTANWACVTYHRAKSKIQKEMEESK
jgi:RNA polymerase sigma-70 factor (ECF subfamily)